MLYKKSAQEKRIKFPKEIEFLGDPTKLPRFTVPIFLRTTKDYNKLCI